MRARRGGHATHARRTPNACMSLAEIMGDSQFKSTTKCFAGSCKNNIVEMECMVDLHRHAQF